MSGTAFRYRQEHLILLQMARISSDVHRYMICTPVSGGFGRNFTWELRIASLWQRFVAIAN